MSRQILTVIPTYVRSAHELEVISRLLESLRKTEPEVEVMLVDDGSPAEDLVKALGDLASRFDSEFHAKEENEGFSRAVNVGLRRALQEEWDVVLCNSDIEFRPPWPWATTMQRQPRLHSDGLADLVGALLSYPSGMIQHGGIYFCQPPGEEVLTARDGYVPIGELDPAVHGLVSYARSENRIFRGTSRAGRWTAGWRPQQQGGYPFRVGQRDYEGRLLVVQSRHGDVTRVTPNHKMTAFWTEEALNSYGVYLMRRGNHWRVGHVKMTHNGGATSGRGRAFGPRMRMGGEDADGVWLLRVCSSKEEAIYWEALLSWTYRVPTWQFIARGSSQERLDDLWKQVDSASGAYAALHEYGRDPEWPLLWGRRITGRRHPIGVGRRYPIHAANLMPECMAIPVDPGCGQIPTLSQFAIDVESYVGKVYSMDVHPHEHYVAGGVIVHNSLLSRTFGHIHQYAPENLPEAQVAKVVPVTGALQFIRLETLHRWGLYDEDFRMGFEDVDYAIRILRDGGESVYQPLVRAYHYESMFRGEKNAKIAAWERDSWIQFRRKWANENFARWVPSVF